MLLYRHAQPAPERDQVRREHAEWSQATFGDVGPVGPLKHLSKEALEAAAEPGDLSEWADIQFLLWDAQRRAGIADEQITQAMIEKLAVNKQREWPEPKDGEPRLHIKAQPAPVVPDAATAIRACLSEFPESARDIVEECADIAENAWRAAMLDNCATVESRNNAGCSPKNGLKCAAMFQDEPVTTANKFGNSPVIPEGYVMVPKEPTEAMINAWLSEVANWRGHVAGYKAMLAAAPQPQNAPQNIPEIIPGWIPVSERMPENDGAYLCWDNRYVTTYAFMFGAWQANQFVAKNITHWMPLPAAPQEVSDA
ncbi:TPA: dATP/dGTP pyrophosphohydrolase domain-containing protein [Klebsiella pneumoniae]